MVAPISYFFIFGIISIALGKSLRNARDSYKVRNEFELQQLLLSPANQDSNEGPSNYGVDVPNSYQENRAGASRYSEKRKPRKVYYQKDKPNPQQYYKYYENAGEDTPNYNSLQIINQFLTQNGDKPSYNNAQNLIEDLLSLDRNNNYQPLKSSDESDNINEVLALLGNLQKNPFDVETYRVIGNGNNIKAKKLLVGANNDQPDAVLIQGKDGILQFVGNIVGKKPQYYNSDYFNKLDDEIIVARDDKDDDSYNDRDDLQSNGKDRARTNRAVNNNNRLRCKGKTCARSKTDVNDSDVKYYSKPHTASQPAQKIKINDDLDAVVLGISDADHLLSKLHAPFSTKSKTGTNKLRANKNVLLQNVDLQNLLNNKNNIGENPNVEAVVLDLTQVENGASVARQVKQLLSQDSEGSYDEYAEYENLVEDHLKQGIYDLQQDIGAGKANTKIIAHSENNNNVYVPQWLLNEVVRSYGGRNIDSAKEQSKLSLPSTRQQNAKKVKVRNTKLFRRNAGQDVGVPFHLEVEGLGQVNP